MKTEEIFHDEDFKPRGAMVFFILLVLLGAVIWLIPYFTLLSRQ